MPITRVEIANSALDLINGQTITAFDENTTTSVLVSRHFDEALRSCLSEGFWRFSVKRVDEPVEDDVTSLDYSYAYELPEDFQRLWRLHPFQYDRPFRVQAGLLQTTWNIAEFDYQSNELLDGDSAWADFDRNADRLFIEYLRYELAYRLAPRIKPDMARDLQMEAQRAKVKALSFCALEESPDELHLNPLEVRRQRGRTIFDTVIVSNPSWDNTLFGG
jgi:hypothetical protein